MNDKDNELFEKLKNDKSITMINDNVCLTVVRKSVSGMKPGMVQVEYTFSIDTRK